MKPSWIAGCLSLIPSALATSSVGTTCATAYTTSHTAPVQTTTYHKRTRKVNTLTHTIHPASIITPTVTSTETDSTTSTYTTTLAIVTDTFSTTVTSTTTTVSTETDTVFSTETDTATSTTTSTTTIQPSAGFQPINGVSDSKRRARRDQAPQNEAPQNEKRNALSSPIMPSSAPGGKRHYPTSVICDVVTTYMSRTTTTITASTQTITAPASTSSVTTTETFSTTSTETQADASTTSTFYTTTTESDTMTATITSATTTTTTQTVQATATYYAACAPNNMLNTDSSNFFYANYNTESYANTYDYNSAYDCCAACIADDNATCAVSYFVPINGNQCTFFIDGACSTSNVAGTYSNDRTPGFFSLTLMNSNCGLWQFSN